jgi:MFS family permease
MTTTDEPVAEPTGLKVLRERNLWPYLLGTLLSGSGTWFQAVAQALLVYRLTGSTFLVGVVGFSQFIGTLVLAPWAGGAADRYDRRMVMVVSQSASIVVTVTLAILAGTGRATTASVVVLAGISGVFNAFSTPAMLSLVPLLVPEHELRGAIALNAATYNLARAIGPVLGAVVVDNLGIPAAFWMNAASYLALILSLLVVHPRPQPDRPTTRPKLRESFALIRGDARLTLLLCAVAVIAFSTDPVTTLTPGFATEVFGHSDTWVGALIGAYGVGAVLAALRAGRVREPERTLAMGMSIMGGGALAFALAPNLGFGLAGMGVAGFGYLTSSTTTSAALQMGVADVHRGRIMALWSVAFVGVRPFASLLDGGIASAFGLRAAGVAFAAPALGMAVLLLVRRGSRGATAPPPARHDPAAPSA